MNEAGPSTHRSRAAKRSRELLDEADQDLPEDAGEEGVTDAAHGGVGESPPKASRRARTSSKKAKSSPGIVYISRLPPGMTPQKVRHLMAKWGDVGKVYAQRRDAGEVVAHTTAPTGYNPNAASQKKQKHQRADFTEAWVEFLSKSVAKTVAQMLNAQMIGGKKGDKWRDDIWTMRYLSGFKWEMLGEQIAYERQSHTARLRNEIARSKTEQGEYLRNVELARVLEKRKQKKAAAAAAAGTAGSGGEALKEPSIVGGKGDRPHAYRQRQSVDKTKSAEGDGMKAVLGSIFG